MKVIPSALSLIILTAMLIACSTPPDEMTQQEKAEDAKELTEAKNTTLEALGASLILSLKENNFQHISEFLPTKEDIENIVMTYEGTDEEKKKILAGSAENSKKIRENTRKAFDEILKKGKDSGITWKNVEFSQTEYNLNPENNVEYAGLTITFIYKVLEYKITIAECIKTEKGWLIFDKPKWKG